MGVYVMVLIVYVLCIVLDVANSVPYREGYRPSRVVNPRTVVPPAGPSAVVCSEGYRPQLSTLPRAVPPGPSPVPPKQCPNERALVGQATQRDMIQPSRPELLRRLAEARDSARTEGEEP